MCSGLVLQSVVFLGVVSLSVAAAPDRARAQSPASVDPAVTASSNVLEGAGADRGPGLRWRWRRFSAAQYSLTGTLLAGTLSLSFSDPDFDYSWNGGMLFDERARNALRARSDGSRHKAGKVSDALLYALTLYPFAVDSGLLALGVHGSPDVAWQMFAINSQAFLLNGFITQLTKLLTRRHRPKTQTCDVSDPSCMDEPKSFFSGHTSMAFTGAGLVCAHATNMPELYGSAAAGRAACASALTAAATVGALRVVADEHYSTDVIMGAAVGLLVGYFVPKWLHYDREVEPVTRNRPRDAFAEGDEPERLGAAPPPARHLVAPLAGPGTVGLSYQLVW